jgi:lipid II:glycine glycyltransferase (peptidoglycan interpeptide bridge formation enzyme)
MLKTESVEKWGYREPPYPLSLFENLYKYAKGTVRLKLAVKDEKVIAGLINIFYGNSVFALFSSYRDEYRSFSPTRLLFKHSFQQACNDNYRYFNLGFSEDLNKVSSFKDTLGGEKYPAARYRIGSYLGKAVNRIICLAR